MYEKEQLEKALGLLGRRLDLESSAAMSLVVCGGAALIVAGLVTRTTKDVDVVAVGVPGPGGGMRMRGSRPLPEALQKAAGQVASDLGMSENWLNCGPSDLMQGGLPDGFMDRVRTRSYGTALTVHFIGRHDQIHLKTYAAVDSGPGRHVGDLLALKPTEGEMESAARWSMGHDPSDGFRVVLRDMLRKLGYESVAERV